MRGSRSTLCLNFWLEDSLTKTPINHGDNAMGNIIFGTQSEYLRLCRLALHDVSEGAICWFDMLDSDFTAASASDHHVFWREFSHSSSTSKWAKTTIRRRLQMPSANIHFTHRHSFTVRLCYSRPYHSHWSPRVSDLAQNEAILL